MHEVIHPRNKPVARFHHGERDIGVAAFVRLKERNPACVPEKERRGGKKEENGGKLFPETGIQSAPAF